MYSAVLMHSLDKPMQSYRTEKYKNIWLFLAMNCYFLTTFKQNTFNHDLILKVSMTTLDYIILFS